jgi:hypothetical protein
MKKINSSPIVYFIFFTIVTWNTLSFAAEISGTVISDTGSAGLGYVEVFAGAPCKYQESYTVASIDHLTSPSYSIQNIPAGNYYITAWAMKIPANHREWWAGSGSSPHCLDAVPISLGENDTVTGIDFELDSYNTTISGHVYGSNSEVISSRILPYYDSCKPVSDEFSAFSSAGANKDGYTMNLPAGEYYIKSQPEDFVAEWWTEEGSTTNCSQAKLISISKGEAITGVDFHHTVLGGQISGEVVDTLRNGPPESFSIFTYTGDPCGDHFRVIGVGVNNFESSYLIKGLAEGEYFVKVGGYYAFADPLAQYASEWWSGNGSSQDCSKAKAVAVSAGETVSGIDFQLEHGSLIKGRVFTDDGPVDYGKTRISAYSGNPCGEKRFIIETRTWERWSGEYTLYPLPAGTYFLKAEAHGMYTQEWWAGDESSPDCHQAQPIVIGTGETVEGKYFSLDKQQNISPFINRLLFGGNK